MAFAFAQPKLVQAERVSSLLRSVIWSPDGFMFLSTTELNTITVSHTPRHTFLDCEGRSAGDSSENHAAFAPSVTVNEADAVRDSIWHPRASCATAGTALFASASKDQPVKLWDALDGGLRATYVATNQSDEVSGAHSLCFSPNGSQLVGGYDRMLHLFDPLRPGIAVERWLTTPARRSKDGQRGIISTLAFNASDPSTFAAGCFDGTIATYDVRSGRASCEISDDGCGDVVDYRSWTPDAAGSGGSETDTTEQANKRRRIGLADADGDSEAFESSSSIAQEPSNIESAPPAASAHLHRTGAARPAVTQVAFSNDGRYFTAGYRRHGEVLVWDARKLVSPALRLARDASSNQRFQYGIDGACRHLVTGSRDGCVIAYDLLLGQAAHVMRGYDDAVPCVALHPAGVAFATASGQRSFDDRPAAGGDLTESDSDAETAGEVSHATSERPGPRVDRPVSILSVWRTTREAAIPSDSANEPATVDATAAS